MPGSDKLVIVLDPGHGGSNEGLKHRGLIEKDMNLVTATAMRDELLQYDNVEVYITNPEKADMSLKQRAEYAQSVGADILISLHFNMSEKHEMHGSEVWIPGSGLGNAKMHGLGDVFMEQFGEHGFTLRGVKTRLNNAGEDYYGIIRESTALGIQSILVEHGYADHLMDYEKVNDEADWKALGISDATAVAKYFGLTSSSLDRDYSDYEVNGYHAPEAAVGSDVTEPEGAVLIHLESTEEGELFCISARDPESEIVYYDYSINGGKTWSALGAFEPDEHSVEVYITNIKPGGKVLARVYNGHFLKTETNAVFYKADEEKWETVQKEIPEILPKEPVTETVTVSEPVQVARQTKTPVSMYGGFILVVFSILLMFCAFATYKERMRIRRSRREGRRAGFLSLRKLAQIEAFCAVLGVCFLLLGVTIFGIAYAGKSAGELKTTSAAAEVLPSETPEEEPEPEPEQEEIPMPVMIDWEKSEGYEEQENGEIVAGEELFTELTLNENAAIAKETVVVYDMAEGYLRVPLLEGVRRNTFDIMGFSGTDLTMDYNGGNGVRALKGIDVSKFQGDIDWQQVRAAGVEFVILRLGIRGYGSGEMVLDERFYDNYRGATEAGMKVGVYFFSAAINETEAVEEAEFVLNAVEGLTLEMPVVFDTEPIFYDDARTDDLTPNQLTSITGAFCAHIKSAGYKPMIYANAKRFTTVLHLEELEEYDKWLADYRSAPDYPYAFKMWQFTESGKVPGISGNVDMNLYFYEE